MSDEVTWSPSHRTALYHLARVNSHHEVAVQANNHQAVVGQWLRLILVDEIHLRAARGPQRSLCVCVCSIIAVLHAHLDIWLDLLLLSFSRHMGRISTWSRVCKHREQLCHGMFVHQGLVVWELNQVRSNHPCHGDVLEKPIWQHPCCFRGTPLIGEKPLLRMD